MRDPLIGAKLGNYEIESALGRGGMARVYRARDVMLGRRVAIKVIEPGLNDQKKYLERFGHEAQAVAKLKHPNIVTVYYFGTHKNLYYLAMQYIEGDDLGEIMHQYATDGEMLPTDDLLRIVNDIGAALDYAHEQGVIHRDVKPTNIMIDRDGTPYLTDFGLALNLSTGTQGEVFGSPHYIAPEQAQNSAQATTQSDIYALGVMLYEIFTGALPFDDPSPTAVALQHIMKKPTPPRSLNPEITPAIEQVILKAMEKKPEDRYKNARALALALGKAVKANPQEGGKLPPLPPMPAGVAKLLRPSMMPVAQKVKGRAPKAAPAPVAPPANAVPAYAAPTPPPIPTRKMDEPKKPAPKVAKSARQPQGRRRSLIPLVVVVLLVALALGLWVRQVVLTEGDGVTTPLNAGDTSGGGQNVQLLWDERSFILMNQTSAGIELNRFRFEKAGDDSIRFDGSQWLRVMGNYQRVDRGNCVIAAIPQQDARTVPLPEGCARSNSRIIAGETEVFWTGDGAFRVLWDGRETVRCSIAAGICSVEVTP